MKEIVIILRCLQLFAHNAHNTVARVIFFQDHEFLNEVYTAAETDYDSVIERIIGLFGSESINLNEIQVMAVQKLNKLPTQVKENSTLMQIILELEKELCMHIEQIVRQNGITVGTEQMLGDIADKSEVRQYKLNQRIKK